MRLLLLADRLMKWLVAIAVAVSALATLFIATISTADVLSYLVFLRPFAGANESVEVALAVTIAMALAYTQARREHVVVDIVVLAMPPRIRTWSILLGLLVGLVCMALLAWRGWALALGSLSVGETAATLYSFPVYPWKILFAIGLTLAALEFLRQIVWFFAGRPETGGVIDPDGVQRVRMDG